MEFWISDEDGRPLDATVEIEPGSIIQHSRGGAAGSPNARNRDYATGLRLILKRLLDGGHTIQGAWVDSSRVQALPLDERMILSSADFPEASETLFTLMSRRMQAVGRDPNAGPGRGNSNKRIRIQVPSATVSELARMIGAVPKREVPRHLRRLPAEELRKVTAEHIWMAISDLAADDTRHAFGPSTDYDLVTAEGVRLPPKAVFGRAATIALGFEVGPEHFSAGIGTPCFNILEAAGYPVVPKGEAVAEGEALSAEDKVWSEGSARLVKHLRRERGRGLAQAKKAAFFREHGRLYCERCGLDPIEVFGDKDGEACIEVHHHQTAVAEMSDGHETRLQDVQCLCANCHRYVHRVMKRTEAQA